MATRKKSQTPPGLKGAATELMLAGMGAFNLAGEEGGRIFKSLVARGRDQKDLNREWLDGLAERAETLKDDAKAALDKVTTPREDGLASALQSLGVPSRKEILALTHRVEALTKHVTRAKAAEKAPAKAKAAAPRKPAPRKAAPRKAATAKVVPAAAD